ncbi:MAG: AAA family ATPase [Nanobdellota archaeon]
MDPEIEKLTKKAEAYSKKLREAMDEMATVIVGQREITEKLILSLISDGNVLLEGVPGLAKTLMIRSLADTLDSRFRRIQFTPDLLPADIIGTKIYKHKEGTFETKKGPIFSNFILADEINRAPPKVQSALLEAMQERQVTISGDTFKLDRPFLVLATQNPVETEGTYRLPEAQVDRFMFKLLIRYPTKEEEKEIIKRMTVGADYTISKKLTPKEIKEIQHFTTQIYCDEQIEDYVVDIIDATRNPAVIEAKDLIEYGSSPRASIWMIIAAKAHALMNGRGYVIPEDVQAIAHDVLRHRLILTYEAEAEDITPDALVERILKTIAVP